MLQNKDATDIITVNLRIYGIVQGVGYRHWTVKTAQKYGISGWVRNRSDGSVEAILKGTKDSIDEMITSCYNGPSFANVEKIDIKLGEYSGEENKFIELPSL